MYIILLKNEIFHKTPQTQNHKPNTHTHIHTQTSSTVIECPQNKYQRILSLLNIIGSDSEPCYDKIIYQNSQLRLSSFSIRIYLSKTVKGFIPHHGQDILRSE